MTFCSPPVETFFKSFSIGFARREDFRGISNAKSLGGTSSCVPNLNTETDVWLPISSIACCSGILVDMVSFEGILKLNMPCVVVDWAPNSNAKLVRELIVILDVLVMVIACCPAVVGCMAFVGDGVGGSSWLIFLCSVSSERIGVVGGEGRWTSCGAGMGVTGFGSFCIAARAEARSTSLPLSGTGSFTSSTATEVDGKLLKRSGFVGTNFSLVKKGSSIVGVATNGARVTDEASFVLNDLETTTWRVRY